MLVINSIDKRYDHAQPFFTKKEKFTMIHYNERLKTGQKTFWSAFIFTFLITFFSSPSPVSCKEYEAPQNQRVSDIFPAKVIKGPHYRIRDQVVSYGYMRHYIVDSDFGVFEVTGDGALRKLLRGNPGNCNP
jgi:hypothetical protein